MIDWHRVRELQDDVGAEDFAEVAQLFLEEADDVITRLKAGVSQDMLEAEFHALKGSALNLGFRDLAETCAQEERRATNGVFGEIDVETVIARYAASKELFLTHQLASSAAA